MKKGDVLLTVEQAAAVGRVPADTLRHWIKTDRLDVIRQAGRVYILRGTLEALLVVPCAACGERFRRGNLRARFCSQRCRQLAHRKTKGTA